MAIAPLDAAAIAARAAAIPEWTVVRDGKALRRRLTFADFDAAFALVTKVAEAAREADHHPDVSFGWGYAEFALTTHAARGLTERDFALATRIDEAFGQS